MLTYEAILSQYQKQYANQGGGDLPERLARQTIVNMHGSWSEYEKKLKKFQKEEQAQAQKKEKLTNYAFIEEDFNRSREPMNHKAIIYTKHRMGHYKTSGQTEKAARLLALADAEREFGDSMYESTFDPRHTAQLDQLAKTGNFSEDHRGVTSAYMSIYGLNAGQAYRKALEESEQASVGWEEEYNGLPWREKAAFDSLSENDRLVAQSLQEAQPGSWTYEKMFIHTGGDAEVLSRMAQALEANSKTQEENDDD